MTPRKADNDGAVSGWENDGGAAPGRDQSAQERLDLSHQSDTRGEHRYHDRHQTPAEQEARQERDDLKQRLARRPAQSSS